MILRGSAASDHSETRKYNFDVFCDHVPKQFDNIASGKRVPYCTQRKFAMVLHLQLSLSTATPTIQNCLNDVSTDTITITSIKNGKQQPLSIFELVLVEEKVPSHILCGSVLVDEKVPHRKNFLFESMLVESKGPVPLVGPGGTLNLIKTNLPTRSLFSYFSIRTIFQKQITSQIKEI